MHQKIYLIKFKSVNELLPIEMLFATLKVTNEMVSACRKCQMLNFTEVHIIFIDKKVKFFNQIASDLCEEIFLRDYNNRIVIGSVNIY